MMFFLTSVRQNVSQNRRLSYFSATCLRRQAANQSGLDIVLKIDGSSSSIGQKKSAYAADTQLRTKDRQGLPLG